MILRPLQEKDAPLMLEWMHDEDLVRDLHKNFAAMTIDNCKAFIKNASKNEADSEQVGNNLHLAITDDNDEYLGTVSLKEIDYVLATAEFGIVIRRAATGHGVSAQAMKQIIDMAFEGKELAKPLTSVFWCVDSANARALRFYDKNGYKRINLFDYPELHEHISASGDYTQEEIQNYVWYLAGKMQK